MSVRLDLACLCVSRVPWGLELRAPALRVGGRRMRGKIMRSDQMKVKTEASRGRKWPVLTYRPTCLMCSKVAEKEKLAAALEEEKAERERLQAALDAAGQAKKVSKVR